MSEQMEQFIRNRRREFDAFEPPAGLWDRIEEQLDAAPGIQPVVIRRNPWLPLLRIAAILVVFAAAALLISRYRQNNRPIDISSINPELGKQQLHYASLIESKRNELREIEKADPILYKEFAGDVAKMDANYQKLKSELATSPNQSETVKAMIRNLQIQIEVLNQQLTIIQEINQFKKGQKNEEQHI